MLNEFTSLVSFVMNARVTLPASVQIAFVVFTLVLSVSVCSQLTVLVRLNDGQITEELLEADSEKDIITVEFKQADGTLITFLSDFKRVSINPTKYNSTTAVNQLKSVFFWSTAMQLYHCVGRKQSRVQKLCVCVCWTCSIVVPLYFWKHLSVQCQIP